MKIPMITSIPLFSLSATVLLSRSCIASSPMNVVDSKSNRHNWEEVLRGVVKGSLGHEVDAAETCVSESERTLIKLEEAIQNIEKETHKSVKRGIRLLGEGMHEVGQALQECKLVAEDVEEFVVMANSLVHPTSFIFHAGVNIVLNHVEIFAEVKAAVIAWRMEPPAYYDFGLNVGEVMKHVLVESAAEDMVAKVA